MTTTPRPGWYPDPADDAPADAGYRWWDGTTWTQRSSTGPIEMCESPYEGIALGVAAGPEAYTRASMVKKIPCEMEVVPSKASALRRWRMTWPALGSPG